MIEKFLKGIGLVVVVALAIAGIAVLGAYPLKWTVNYPVNPQWLLAAFGTSHIGFWQAYCMEYIAGSLIKGTPAASK